MQRLIALLSIWGIPSNLVAADIGAGTGISSRLLVDRGIKVIARQRGGQFHRHKATVEVAIKPNAAMREMANSSPFSGNFVMVMLKV